MSFITMNKYHKIDTLFIFNIVRLDYKVVVVVSENRDVALTVSLSAQDTSEALVKPMKQSLQRSSFQLKASKRQKCTGLTMPLSNRFDALISVA